MQNQEPMVGDSVTATPLCSCRWAFDRSGSSLVSLSSVKHHGDPVHQISSASDTNIEEG